MTELNLTNLEKIKIEVLLEHELRHSKNEMLGIYREAKAFENMKFGKRDCKRIYKIMDKIIDSRKS